MTLDRNYPPRKVPHETGSRQAGGCADCRCHCHIGSSPHEAQACLRVARVVGPASLGWAAERRSGSRTGSPIPGTPALHPAALHPAALARPDLDHSRARHRPGAPAPFGTAVRGLDASSHDRI